MFYTPSLSSTDFIVGVTSVKFGKGLDHAVELLQFSDPTGAEYLPAIMDSGTSCLVLPGDDLDGKLTSVPFDDFSSLWEKDASFFITIGGKQHEVPYSSWFLARTNQTCVQPSPSGMQGLLIGDIFFRSYLVEFDMQDADRPIIGIARLRADYMPVTTDAMHNLQLAEVPVHRLALLRGEETMYPASHRSRLEQVDQIPIFNKKGTQYFMRVAVGTPAQPFTVIFDTGSAVFGVFTREADLPNGIRSQLRSRTALKVRDGAMSALMVWTPAPSAMILSAQRRAAVLAMAAADLASAAPTAGSLSGPALLGSVLLALNALAFLTLLRRRHQQRAGRCYRMEQVSAGQSYGAVVGVTVTH
jgi:hypothetical protein